MNSSTSRLGTKLDSDGSAATCPRTGHGLGRCARGTGTGRGRPSALLAAVACVLGFAISPVIAHESPATSMFLDYTLNDDALVVIIEAATHHFEPLAGIDPAAPPADPGTHASGYLDFLAANCPVVVDGSPVRPEIQSFDFSPFSDEILPGREGTLLLALTAVRYPLEVRPERIELTWKALPKAPPGFTPQDFEVTGHVSMEEVFASYRIGDGPPDFVQFSPRQSTVTWEPSAGTMTGSLGAAEAVVAGPTLEELQFTFAVPQRKLTIPVLSLALAGLAAIPLFGRPRALAWRFRWRVAAVVLAAAVLLRHQAVWAVPLSDPPASDLLSAGEATELFKALHRNIYTAFDRDSPDEIYDVLSLSIDGPLLDRVYTEVYQSLVLQEADGAMATVRSVDMVDCAPAPDRDGAGFEIPAEWTVEGYVAHSGHIHLRRNRYRAVYRMNPVDGLWKITFVETLESERILAEQQEGDAPQPAVPSPDEAADAPEAGLFPTPEESSQ